jgi:PAS domain S-box-containing protein
VRAEHDRFELLAQVGRAADGASSLAEAVERLLGIVVPAFADLAMLDAVSPGSELRRLGARAAGPRSEEVERALLRRRRIPDATFGMAKAVGGGESHIITASEEHMRALASSDADLELLLSLKLRRVLFVPLRSRGRVLGALACAVGKSGRDYSDADLRFAEVLSGRIALALDNAGLTEMVGELEQRLEATLANLAEAVLVRDAQGRIVFANPAAAGLLGVSAVEDVTGAPRGELMARFDVFDESGRRLTIDDLPAASAQRGETPEPLLARNVVRATGQERWLVNKATPAFDRDGNVSLVVSVIEDVTEVKRAELAQRLLADVSKELSASLDYQQTLQRLAQLAVPGLADWCGVVIRGDDDVLEQVAVAHVDPKKIALVRRFGETYPTRMSDPARTAEVIRSGHAQLIPEITEEVLSGRGLGEERIALVRALGMRSALIVPLAAVGRPPIGALTLVMAESGRVFDRDDVAVAEELGRRAATAVENARLYTERSRIAATLQHGLLPPELPDLPGFRLASLYRAAGDQNEVGGDFYDAFEVPGGWLAVVGDVVGRGAEAAALTSLSRYTLRTACKLLGDPLKALAHLNDAVRERSPLAMVSVACVLLRAGDGEAHADIVLAGHPPPYHVRGGEPRLVGSFGALLGASDSGGWTPERVELGPGDKLVLYTDGVIDTVGERERFGEERLTKALRLQADESAARTVERIDDAVRRFGRGPQVDDSAVLVVERVTEPAAVGGDPPGSSAAQR